MLRETFEITPAYSGLGTLTEPGLMTLFSVVQAHRLTEGRGTTVSDLVDRDGRELYPAYYMTHLTVPPFSLLSSFRLWDKVEMGVAVSSFGVMLLDSHYVVARAGELGSEDTELERPELPSMRSSSMFVAQCGAGEPQVAAPRPELIAELTRLTQPPRSMDRFRELRVEGRIGVDGGIESATELRIVPGRDAAPGRTMLFAGFVDLMDHAELELLEGLTPRFPIDVIESRSVLERETYYFGSCRGGDVVRLVTTARVERPDPSMATRDGIVAGGLITLAFEVYDRTTGSLLALSKARKLLAVSASSCGAIRDAERMLARHGD